MVDVWKDAAEGKVEDLRVDWWMEFEDCIDMQRVGVTEQDDLLWWPLKEPADKKM